jgi:hypothetical protein
VSVADFLKVGDGFFQRRQLISLIDGKLPKRNWQIYPKCLADFPKKIADFLNLKNSATGFPNPQAVLPSPWFRSKAVGYLSGRS